ncbi:hypothetical protein IG631_16025 [Alternaria alternata]|nr:hypothetical protein IG631_16025 [Alternaria alternata]
MSHWPTHTFPVTESSSATTLSASGEWWPCFLVDDRNSGEVPVRGVCVIFADGQICQRHAAQLRRIRAGGYG